MKGIVGTDESLEDGIPQVAFIGRSNVGKSSTINSLVYEEGLARTSPRPGYTQQINLFLINKSFYLVDLPGYGFAAGSKELREQLYKLITWYLFESPYEQKKIVMIIDAEIGITATDAEMLQSLEEHSKNIIIVANKIDKIQKSLLTKQLQEIQDKVGDHLVIPYSSKNKVGVEDLSNELLK
jgi:GTP-binding protein